MFKRQSSAPDYKPISALINPKSHVQKRYFSLMLVPSYSTGKTRSLRIPYAVFYFLIISFLTISAVILGFYLRASYFKHIANNYSLSLDEAQEAYQELQETSASEQNRLLYDSNQLKSMLTEEQQRNRIETNQQRQEYQESLNSFQEQVDELENQLRELDETRQDVIDQLGAKAYIPPVRNILSDLSESQTVLLASVNELVISSDERSASAAVTVDDLQDYAAALSAKIQAQLNCFTDLQSFINRANPYIKNYPTRWPVFGKISSAFGYRQNPMGGRGGEHHDGMDIRCSTGTSVHATGGGVVKVAGWQGSFGYLVVIDHGFGIETYYGHNSSLSVSVGQRVERGDIIAKSGNTGRSTGPHVHYEVRVNGTAVNPNKYLLE